MKTLEQLRQRCVIDADDKDSCWLLLGRLALRVYPGDGISKAVNTTPRRAAWMLAHRQELPTDYRVISKCGNPECVRPSHIRAVHVREFWDRLVKSNELKNRPAKIKASRDTGRKLSKLTEEECRYVQTSNDLGIDLAARFNCHPSLISKLRLGQHGLCWGARANPWAGLLKATS